MFLSNGLLLIAVVDTNVWIESIILFPSVLSFAFRIPPAMDSIGFASQCYTRVSNDRFIATCSGLLYGRAVLSAAIERMRSQCDIKLYASLYPRA